MLNKHQLIEFPRSLLRQNRANSGIWEVRRLAEDLCLVLTFMSTLLSGIPDLSVRMCLSWESTSHGQYDFVAAAVWRPFAS
jgi:hypothetical protein